MRKTSIGFGLLREFSKRAAERAGLRTAFKSRAREGRDTKELQGIERRRKPHSGLPSAKNRDAPRSPPASSLQMPRNPTREAGSSRMFRMPPSLKTHAVFSALSVKGCWVPNADLGRNIINSFAIKFNPIDPSLAPTYGRRRDRSRRALLQMTASA